jgi:GT2 family glycosyltransferase
MIHRTEPLTAPDVSAPPGLASPRPRVTGKFLAAGDETLFVRGVTYGTFRPDVDGAEYRREVVERDFEQMARNGVNTVRTYTAPPRWLLDAAQRYCLRVMVGLPWEQHIAFLEGRQPRAIEERVRAGVRDCAGHPAVLCYAIGNEIPASIVRWYGPRRVERFLERLCRAAKVEDPEGLVTYVNYPSTEYLCLPFLDFVAFNVYLESQDRLRAYLARLHNLAGDRPLLLAEIGLDSRRHGEDAQAHALDWQIRSVFAGGCAGAFAFAWTDEWHRGGYDVDDWDFGLTDRDRRPKPALAAVRDAFADVPFPRDSIWPRISVVVCSHNGARTIQDCLEGLRRLDYPNFEVIVVDDGSTDRTAAIAAEYDIRLIRTENRGLSSARNFGLAAASGEIVAYIDDDARPDPHWLTYLAATFLAGEFIGVGGPNIAPPGDGAIAECVASSPGGPAHVLLTDEVAEHIPGCNMAFRVEALRAIGGFDPRFRVAGDDVDVCWRLQERGWTLGFSPAAVVWHHRRNSIRAYWRQQVGYGRAEALLEAKWPERYNAAGHLTWAGRLYGKGLTEPLSARRGRIYHGAWGSAPFQSLYEPASGLLASLPLMPEWWLVVLSLAGLSALGMLWAPLLLASPLLALALGAPVAQAGISAAQACVVAEPRGRFPDAKRRGLTTLLHVLQPIARLRGRQLHGLTPWRRRGGRQHVLPRPRSTTVWTESWREPATWLEAVEANLRQSGAVVARGGPYDRWDLACRGGTLGASRLLMTIEEHGGGNQYVRFRWWPWCPIWAFAVPAVLLALALFAASDSPIAAAVLGLGAAAQLLWLAIECATPVAAFQAAVNALADADGQPAAWLRTQAIELPGSSAVTALPAVANGWEEHTAVAQQVRSLASSDGQPSRRDDRPVETVR